jgi:hypothetical protein
MAREHTVNPPVRMPMNTSANPWLSGGRVERYEREK